MKSTFPGIAICFTLIASIATSQAQLASPPTTAPHLEFETASVKLHPMAPGTYLIKNFPHSPPFVIPTSTHFTEAVHAQDLIMEAYGVSEYQILYLPPNMRGRESVVYDIDTKSPGNATPTPAQYQQMLQSLLADRFHLKAHWDTKPKFSVYVLVPDKNGPKFHEYEKGQSPATNSAGQPFAGTTLFALAHFLSPNMDFPVIDGTGHPDTVYDFDLDSLVNYREIDREQSADPTEAQDYLRSSVQGVLGLKMDLRKVSMPVLAIDHIDELSHP